MGPLRRDSMSRCDQSIYSNPYSVTNHKDMKKMTGVKAVPKDTLELSGENLKKEALNRLRHTKKYTIFQAGFMRVGKYVFLGVVFPPYLILYGIPKWTFTVVLPAIKVFSVELQQKIIEKFKKWIEAIQVKINNVAIKIQRKLAQLIQPIVQAYLEMGKAVKRGWDNTINFFQKTARFFKRGTFNKKNKNSPITYLKGLFKQVKEKIGIYFNENLVKFFQKSKQKIKNVLTSFSTIKLAKPKQLYQALLNISKPFLERFQKSHNMAQKVIGNVLNQLQTDRQFFTEKFISFKNQCKIIATPVVEGVQSFFKKHVEQISQFLQVRLAQFNRKVEKGLLTLQKLAHTQHFAEWKSGKWLPPFMRPYVAKFLESKFIQKDLATSFKATHWLLNACWNLLKRLGHFILGFSRLGWKYVCVMINSINKIIINSLEYLVVALDWIVKAIRLTLYHVLVWLIMLSILVVWALKKTSRYLEPIKKL